MAINTFERTALDAFLKFDKQCFYDNQFKIISHVHCDFFFDLWVRGHFLNSQPNDQEATQVGLYQTLAGKVGFFSPRRLLLSWHKDCSSCAAHLSLWGHPAASTQL